MVKTNRGFWRFLGFSIITLGVYAIVWWFCLGKDANKICDDGKHQINYIVAMLLGCVTLGIVPIVWLIKLLCRIYGAASRKGVTVYGSVAFLILSYVLLSWTVVCPLIAFSQLCKTTNSLASKYNEGIQETN